MADIESNIRIGIDTTDALSAIKNLQRQISAFHSAMQQSGNAANAAISEGMQRNLINSINATKQFSASLTNVKSSSEAFTESLEKNKFSMGQYFKYAAGSTKTFGKIFTSEFNTIEKVARERVKTIQTQYIKMGRDANGAIQAIKVRPLKLDMENLGTQIQIAAQKQQIFNQLMKQGSTNLLNFGKNTQWAGRQLMVGFTIPLTMLGTTAIKTFMDMEKQVLRFKRVYGELFTTQQETDAMVKQLQSLANEFTKYGVAVADTMALAADAAAMGKMGAELTAQVSEATRLAVLGGVEQSQALETTISLTNAFGIAAEDLSGKINFLNSVENQTVTSIEDLTVAVPKAGPVIQQLGGDVEDLAFFMTAMKEGGINASEGANALKSGLASLINPTGKASEFLQSFGINVKNIVESNKGDVKGLVIDFAQALDTLDPLNRARAIEQMFGKFQFARISTLFQNVIQEGTQAQRVLGLTRASSEELAILAERELKRVEDSPMFKFQKSIEDIKTSLVPLGQEFIKLITPLVEFGTGLIKQFNGLDEGVKKFAIGAVAVLGLIAPAALMTFGLLSNGVANIIKAVTSVNSLFYKLAGAASDASGPMGYFTQEQLEAAGVAASLEQAHANLTQQFTVETNALMNLKAAYEQAAIAINQFNAAAATERATVQAPPVAPPIVRVPGSRRVQSPGGTIPGFANGVFNLGGPRGAGDILPAMLAPGETVVSAEMTRKYGPLLKSIIADNVPGYKNSRMGFEETHMANNLPMTDAVIDQVDKLEAGFSRLAPKLQEAFVILSDLTATKSERLNQSARGLGLTSSEFTQEWNKNSGAGFANVAERARNAGQLGSGSDIDAAVAQLDIEVGQRIAEKIDNGNIDKSVKGWLDTLMADVTQTVIQEFATSGNEARQQVGAAMAQRAATPASLRTRSVQDIIDPSTNQPYGSADAYFRAQIAAGNAELRNTSGRPQVFAANSEFGMPIGRTTSRGTLRTNSASPNRYIGKVLGGTYENPRSPAFSDNLVSPASGVAESYLGISPQDDGTQDAQAYEAAKSAELNKPQNDPYVQVRNRNSPHQLAGPDGADDARAYLDSFNSQASRGGSVPPLPKPPVKPAGSTPLPQIPGFPTPASPQSLASEATATGNNIGKRLLKGIDEKLSDMFTTGALSKTKLGQAFKDNAISNAIQSGNYQNGVILVDSKGVEGDRADLRPNIGNIGKADIDNGDANALAFDADGNPIVDKKGNQLTQNQHEKVLKKQAAAQKRGRLAGKVAGGMSLLTMGLGVASGMGGPVGDVAQQIMPVAGALTAILPMLTALPLPLAALAAAVGLVAYGLYKMHSDLENTKKEARELAYAMSSGKKAMDGFAEFAGKATASEIMAKRREGQFVNFTEKPGKTQFGQNFVKSETGQEYLATAQKAISEYGRAGAAKQMALQLSSAVAQGIFSKEQASNMSYYIGQSLGDMSIAIQMNAKLNELITNDGTNVLRDPLVIQTQLIEVASENLTGAAGSLTKLMKLSGEGKGFWQTNWEEVGKLEGKVGGEVAGFMEQTQAAVDALDVSYGDVIARLKEEGKLAEANAKQDEWLQKRGELLSKNAEEANKFLDSISAITQEYQQATDAEGNFTGSTGLAQKKASVDAIVDQTQALALKKFEGTEDADRAKKLLEQISDAQTLGGNGRGLSATTSIIFNTAIQSDQMSLDTAENLLETFSTDEDEKTLDMVANMMVRYGNSSVQQIDKITSLFGDDEAGKTKKTNFIAMMDNQNPEGFTQVLDAFTMMAQYDGVLGLDASVIVDYYTNYPGELSELQGKLDGLKKMSEAGKMDINTIIEEKYITDPAAAATLKKNAEYFNSLDPFQQFIYLQTMLTMQDTVTEGEIAAYLSGKNVKAKGSVEYDMNTGLSVNTGQYSEEQLAQGQADLIADRAKAITEAMTFNDAPVNDPGNQDPGGSKSNPFANLLSRLKLVRDAGINAAGGIEELIKALKKGSKIAKGLFEGVDQQLTKAGYSKEFIDDMMALDEEQRKQFMTVDKKGKVTVTDAGKTYQQGLREAALGDYQAGLVRQTADLGYQARAFDALSGYKLTDAQRTEIASDANLAYAIATASTTEEVENLVKWLDELDKRQKALDSKTVAGREKIVSEAKNKIDEYFAAVEAEISDDFEEGTNTSGKNATGINLGKERDIISAAQFDIAARQDQIDDLQYLIDGIAEKEDEINEKYDKRAEALEKVWDLNKDIAEQQRGQLDIAQALASGDIAAAAKAMQEEQQRRAQKAQEVQRDALEKSREKELSKITATNGKTRLEIEKEIKKISKEIGVIEETRLEPAEKNVRYGEQARDAALKSVSYLGQTKAAWDEVAEAARLATVKSDDFAKSIKKAFKDIPGFLEQPDGTFKFDSAAFQTWLTNGGGSGDGDSGDGGNTPNANQAKIDELNRLRKITREKYNASKDEAYKKRLWEINVKRGEEIKALGGIPLSSGGLVPKYFAAGGFARGTDTIPAMLTPGEFVMRKYAVQNYGIDRMKAINSGTYEGESVYNYSVNVNVKSDANPDDIASAVMSRIRQIDSQRIRSNRY